MATNVFFTFIDSQSNPLTGSKVSIRPYNPPYVSASCLTFGGPRSTYSDITGSAYFGSVVPGIYKVSFSNANANNPNQNNILQNFENTIFYINIPETSGSTVNGQNYVLTPAIGTNYGTSSFSVTSSYSLTASILLGTISSASYAFNASTASYITSSGTRIVSGSFQLYNQTNARWYTLTVSGSIGDETLQVLIT